MTKFSSRVAAALKMTKLSNEELAQILGVNKNTISAYKNAKGDLKGIVLVGLVEHFGFSPTWLLTGEGDVYAADEKKVAAIGGPNVVDIEHSDLIKGFKDKPRAKKINENLLEIERLSPKVFEKVDQYVSDTADTVRLTAGDKDSGGGTVENARKKRANGQ